MKFNERLLDLRKKNGWSQEELGEKLGVSRQTISKWESGQTTPELEKLRNLAKLFNTSVDELINEEEKDNRLEDIVNENVQIKPKNKTGKKVCFLIILSLILLYIIIVVHRFLIIVKSQEILTDAFSKTTYMKIENWEIVEEALTCTERMDYYKYKIDNYDMTKVEEYGSGGTGNLKRIRYAKGDDLDWTLIEIIPENNTYQYVDNDWKYWFEAHTPDLWNEFQRHYNNIDVKNAIAIAMNLNIKIVKVKNAAMNGYYISDRSARFEDFCSLTIDTTSNRIILDRKFYDEETRAIKGEKIYRYTYNKPSRPEEADIPDLTNYTLISE
ncbi:MAG: helix-turn-helix transcriptional regulator [Clostridia bacterium]|nr:helix-turn-helix transcriptional regulator [Clostridia bacterium]